MPTFRRDLLKALFSAGAVPHLMFSPDAAKTPSAFFDEAAAQAATPDFDPKAYDFWAGFLAKTAEPVTASSKEERGGSLPGAVGGSAEGGSSQTRGRGPGESSDLQPIFLHYGTEGFKNAAELDPAKLAPEGDVIVSVNTNIVKIASKDQQTFERLQNAQIRVDVAQKTAILPIVEAMAYTVVGGMRSEQITEKNKTSAAKKAVPAIQSISVDSDAAWQKMQNIPLPGGEGRWALNLEAQKKDSLFCQVLQNVVKEAGLFTPVIGLPGIALSALQSFNILYGAMHAKPVSIMQAPPVRVFATQEALQSTGAPGAVTGLLLQSGTYVLLPANQLPSGDDLNKLTVIQGRVVPPKTATQELDDVAANTLPDVTYVSFDVQVKPTTLFTTAPPKKTA
jgi:hypothetical protein